MGRSAPFTALALATLLVSCHEKRPDVVAEDAPVSEPTATQQDNRKPEALYEVGLAFLENNDPDDDTKGRNLIVQAAEKGLLDAQYSAGVCFQRGLGGPEDLDTAYKWLRKAAERGQRDAQYKMAHAYRVGNPLAKDEVRARQLYLAAAEQGHGHAQYNIAVAYQQGVGGPVDVKESITWLEVSAARNHPPAVAKLVTLYMKGAPGFSPNARQALVWMQVAKRLQHRFGPSAQQQMQALEKELRGSLSEQEQSSAEEDANAWLAKHLYPSSTDYVPPGTSAVTKPVDAGGSTVSATVPAAVPYEQFVKLRPSK